MQKKMKSRADDFDRYEDREQASDKDEDEDNFNGKNGAIKGGRRAAEKNGKNYAKANDKDKAISNQKQANEKRAGQQNQVDKKTQEARVEKNAAKTREPPQKQNARPKEASEQNGLASKDRQSDKSQAKGKGPAKNALANGARNGRRQSDVLNVEEEHRLHRHLDDDDDDVMNDKHKAGYVDDFDEWLHKDIHAPYLGADYGNSDVGKGSRSHYSDVSNGSRTHRGRAIDDNSPPITYDRMFLTEQ
jgi:hypothetical protein